MLHGHRLFRRPLPHALRLWFSEDRATHLRFFFDHRKNDQNYTGHWVDIAVTDAGSASFPGFSAVAQLRAAAVF